MATSSHQTSSSSSILKLSTPVTFPVSKQTIPNRLVKAATTELLADPNTGQPNERHCQLYARFEGCGMILTGNVMVDRQHRESARNVVLDEYSNLDAFRTWERSFPSSAKAVMQISHPGRQSPLAVTGWGRHSTAPVAPTSGLRSRLLLPGPLGKIVGSLLLRPPRELSAEELPFVVEQFATTARLAQRAGFAGVEIHAAHGYLLSQFLSPSANRRTDGYGGDAGGRRRLLLEVIRGVREATAAAAASLTGGSKDFIVGVKINSKDRRSEGKEREDECIALVGELCRLQMLDFIELSPGGDFAHAFFMQDDVSRGVEGGFVYSFAERLQNEILRHRQSNDCAVPAIISTGGFRTAEGMERAVSDGVSDLIGLGRPLVMNPSFCREILCEEAAEAKLVPLSFYVAKSLLEPVLNSLWYSRQLERLSLGLWPDENMSILYSLTVTFFRTYIWDWGKKRITRRK